MNKQPEALRLAAFCDGNVIYQPAAAELRRLHEVNTDLLEALQSISEMYDYETSVGELASRLYSARCISIASIAKATGAAHDH